MLEIHGTADRSVPYSVVPGWVGTWLRLDGCPFAMRTSGSLASAAAMAASVGPAFFSTFSPGDFLSSAPFGAGCARESGRWSRTKQGASSRNTAA